MSNFLFLDVDGVLNTIRQREIFGTEYIDPQAVQLLSRIINRTKAKIILSSSWRLNLEDRGRVMQAIRKGELEIYDYTPRLGEGVDRSEEISHWLRENPTQKFAILDDDPRAEITGSFFLVDDDGLTAEVANSVIEHLLAVNRN